MTAREIGEARFLSLSTRDVETVLEIDTAIDTQRTAFTELATGNAVLPNKIMVPGGGSVALCYAARVGATGTVCKIVSVNPDNAEHGLPSLSATIAALDPITGRLAAVIDGTAITTHRTAAASALAASALSNDNSEALAVLGCGVQGRAHVRAIARVRDIRAVRMWSPDSSERSRVTAELADELGISVEPTETAADAVATSHIVATCTLATEPVLRGEWLRPGATVLSVGSFEPHRHEVDRELVGSAQAVIVDDPATAIKHAGPIIDAINAGRLAENDLIGLGDVLLGRAPARTSSRDIVFYNSTGLGVQDAAIAWTVIQRAKKGGIGQWISL